MPDDPIHIRHVKLGELESFAESCLTTAKPGGFIPITLQRARAMAHNPFGSVDDVALLAAYHADEVIGYFGIMAVRLYDGSQYHKAHWFTTWMVNPHYLGRGVGSMLMKAALDLDKDFFIVGSKPARRVCDKFGFERMPVYRFSVLDLGLAGRWNPVSLALRLLRKAANRSGGRLDIAKANQRAERFFEALLGWLLRPGLYALARREVERGTPEYRFEKVSQVRAVDVERRPEEGAPRLVRGVEAVNWMLAYPWVLRPGQSPSEGLDFYFSDTRPEFECWAVEAYRDGYCGYVAMQFSVSRGRRVLKVLDAETRPGDERFVLQAALRAAKERRAERIEMAAEHAVVLRGTRPGRLLLESRERICQVHPRSADSPLAKVKDRLALHYTDGDMAFT